MNDVAGEMIPIFMFMGLTVIISLFFWFRYRGRQEMQATIRAAIKRGQDLTPELIESFGSPEKAPKDKDLRAALIWLAIAAGMLLIGVSVSYFAVEAFYGLAAAAALPFCLGLAYIIMWRYTEREQ